MKKIIYLLMAVVISILLIFQFFVFPNITNTGMETSEYVARGIINAIRYTGLSIVLTLIAGFLYLKSNDKD